MFTPETVAQMAAYFTAKESRPIDVLKLVKLMYLADRESMFRYGYPISYDKMISMRNGPVLSQVYDLIDGKGTAASQQIWNRWISPRDNDKVGLTNNNFTEQDLDYFSVVNLEVLSCVWNKFGGMNGQTLRDYTHENCDEWSKPNGQETQTPINDIDIFRALGITEDEATELADEIAYQRYLDKMLAVS